MGNYILKRMRLCSATLGVGTDVVDDVRSQVFGSRCDSVEELLHWED